MIAATYLGDDKAEVGVRMGGWLGGWVGGWGMSEGSEREGKL